MSLIMPAQTRIIASGKTLEEIDTIFMQHHPVIDPLEEETGSNVPTEDGKGAAGMDSHQDENVETKV